VGFGYESPPGDTRRGRRRAGKRKVVNRGPITSTSPDLRLRVRISGTTPCAPRLHLKGAMCKPAFYVRDIGVLNAARVQAVDAAPAARRGRSRVAERRRVKTTRVTCWACARPVGAVLRGLSVVLVDEPTEAVASYDAVGK
jgi:hypothetical protein